jgi:hypothetical protein
MSQEQNTSEEKSEHQVESDEVLPIKTELAERDETYYS